MTLLSSIGGSPKELAPWVIPLLVVLTLAAGAVGYACQTAASKVRAAIARDAGEVCEDMDQVRDLIMSAPPAARHTTNDPDRTVTG